MGIKTQLRILAPSENVDESVQWMNYDPNFEIICELGNLSVYIGEKMNLFGEFNPSCLPINLEVLRLVGIYPFHIYIIKYTYIFN